MTWLNAPDNIEKYVGYVYVITELSTGKKYIGIKKFWKTVKLKALKGRVNKRHKIKESDWRTYNSSNKELQEKIKNNPVGYKKRIVHCCKSVTDMKAHETYLQLTYYFNGKWDELFNEVINLRLRIRKN